VRGDAFASAVFGGNPAALCPLETCRASYYLAIFDHEEEIAALEPDMSALATFHSSALSDRHRDPNAISCRGSSRPDTGFRKIR
jgi:hypothetical protein